MPKAAVKLFRDPENAKKAARELRSKGFGAKEIGILVRDKEKATKFASPKASTEVMLPEAGAAFAVGPLAKAGKKATLASLLDLPEETISYYEFGVSVGGVLISVHADEGRLPQAQQILRAADVPVAAARGEMWATSPGFVAAGRMTETDPIDTKMTGDFRRY
ncbi:MAG: hypothetical protein ACE5IE_00725 [Dehalococcoidia bacterium]